MKNCPNCHASIPDVAKFCPMCRTNIKEYENKKAATPLFCMECGAELVKGAICCMECGTDIVNTSGINASKSSFNFASLDNLSTVATEQLYEQQGFKVENGVLVEYTGKKRSFSIPGSIEEIFDMAFKQNQFITNVDIEEGVKVIGKHAFYNCISLAEVSIPSTCENICEGAFQSCSSLSKVTISNGVTLISTGMFNRCKNLKSVDIPSSVTSIGGSAFYDCTSLTTINIPNNVTFIGSYAFSECPNLIYNEFDNGLYLGNSDNPYMALVKVKNTAVSSFSVHKQTKIICSVAFINCPNLESVIISNNVTYIGDSAFTHCRKLNSIDIPSSVTSIGSGVFNYCENLKTIKIPKSCIRASEIYYSCGAEIVYY